MISEQCIEQQRNQIQLRIKHLEQKLKPKNNKEPKDSRYELRESHTHNLRNIIKQQPQKRKDQPNINNIESFGHQQFVEQSKENISEHKNELYQMMKNILIGQKYIEKQLKELKLNYSKGSIPKQQNHKYESVLTFHKKNISPRNQPKLYDLTNSTPQEISLIQPNYQKEYSRNNNKYRPSRSTKKVNQYGDSKSRPVSNTKSLNKTNQKAQLEFLQKLQYLKNQRSKNERIKINQQIKLKINEQVQKRVIQSQKQYKDPQCKNNKHEAMNLLGTIQLQKKMKDNLIMKVYKLCNNYVYK